jgi:hypothetical protein
MGLGRRLRDWRDENETERYDVLFGKESNQGART